MNNNVLNVYLAGEIHSDWREQIIRSSNEKGLDVVFTSPITNHDLSDMCGVNILGEEEKPFWRDRKGSGLNAIRRMKMIKDSDIVVVRFGPKFKQWNAAFDAGYAAALNKSIITLHDEEHDHALKEVDEAANATARSTHQVVQILEYVLS
ncbi:MAG: YtoQ family protein [Candidatus Dadabacteria bacterium]|nr:YtoQ family protein [Candidatus Dadabacteria bacterium]NIQ16044.1 YtoQ family protein [Candidatus Dadabacteria bacterium]